MIRDFHFTREFVLYELPLNQAFALMAWSTEMNPWSPVKRVTEGYIARERLDRPKTP